MVAVAGSAGDALVEFDEFVGRLGAAVVGAAGVEVGQERVAPLLQRLAQPLALRDRKRRQRADEVVGDAASLGWALRPVGRPQLLRAQPGDEDLVMALVGSDRAVQPGTLPVGELLLTTAQDRADAVERVVLAATVAVDLLLHTPAVLAAFFEPVALRLARPAGDQVEQPRLRPACVGIRGEVDHPGQLLGSTAAVLDRELADVVPHVLVHTEPFHAGEAPLVVGHRLQQQLDRGSHRVPRRPELLRQAADRCMLAAELVDRPTNRLGSIQMSKNDLRARPIYQHLKESIQAHLAIVFAALATWNRPPAGAPRSSSP